MKKRLISVFLVLTLVLLMVTACSTKAPSGDSSSTTKAPAKTYMTIGTSGTGGTLAILGAAIAKVVNDNNSGYMMNVENTPSGAAGNVMGVSAKQMEFGLAGEIETYNGYLGQGSYKEAQNNIRTVATGFPFYLHVFALESSNIKTIEDIKGKKVAGIGASGTTQLVNILKVCGLEEKDYGIITYTLGEAIDAMKDGSIDVIGTQTTLGAATITDLISSQKTVFIPFTEAQIKAQTDAYPFYTAGEIPAGSYAGQDKAIPTTILQFSLIAGEQVPEDVVYNVVKTLCEKNSELANIYPPAAAYNLENQVALAEKKDPVPPLHDGAIKYYKEAGIIK